MAKKLLAILLSAVCLLTPTLSAGAAAKGDVDADGKVTAADAREALRIAVGLSAAEQESDEFTAADADSDGRVTAADARLILRAAVGLETLRDAAPGEKPDRRAVYAKANRFTVEIAVDTDDYSALGSGFFISEDGRLVTNYHVVANAKKLEATDCDGNVYPVEQVLGVDRDLDLAVLKVTGSFPYAELNKTDYETADTVYALGSSQGLTSSFSEGMISNKSRELEGFPDTVYIQHTAAISEGNSGGPLMDEYGRVIGVNTMGAEDGQLLNFSVPISCLDRLDLSAPLSVEAFHEAELNFKSLRLLTKETSETLHMKPGGFAAETLRIESKTAVTPVVECDSDAVTAALYNYDIGSMLEVLGYGVTILTVTAKAPCENATVTVYLKEAPEQRVTLTVTADAAGSVNYGGALDIIPDFGAMTGIAPSSVDVSGIIGLASVLPALSYDDRSIRSRSADELRGEYEALLTEAGFTNTETTGTPLRTVTTYVYTNAKYGVSIQYIEAKAFGRLQSVIIMLG